MLAVMAGRPCVCKCCNRTELEAGIISRTGLCIDCGAALVRLNVEQLRTRQGPLYDRWRAGCAAAAGRFGAGGKATPRSSS